jgi:hypothetical protein
MIYSSMSVDLKDIVISFVAIQRLVAYMAVQTLFARNR